MFRDECELSVQAGRGGDGVIAFHREKFVPRGGPDGGDGGDGGDVVLRATDQLNSLLHLGHRRLFKAGNGQPGGGKNCSGARGEDLRIEVPVGTQVFDARRGHLLCDLAESGRELAIARGGRGGRGNARFATAVRQTPRIAENGTAGEERSLRLELKLLAEAGLVGLPNAGKSTFLARVSAARPKIADYPFTTLVPQVGIAAVGEMRSLFLADLPGLIEGAAEGAGLGHRFLRHVERCKVLLHLVDVSGSGELPPLEARRVVQAELERYSPALASRPRLLVATKCESPAAELAADELERETGAPVHRISSHSGRGLPELLEEAWRRVHAPAAPGRPA